MNENHYMVKCCPKCKGSSYFKEYTGTDGFFTSKRFSHYMCEDCNHKFKITGYVCTVSRDTVADLVQKAIRKKISSNELIKEFRKLGVVLFKY